MLSVLFLVGWVVIGVLLVRRHRVAGTAVLWFVILGPLGLLLVAYGEWRRSTLGPEPDAAQPTAVATQNLALPVQVEADGAWRHGELQTWATTDLGWHGWVHYTVDGDPRSAWFPEGQVRPPASPEQAPDPTADREPPAS